MREYRKKGPDRNRKNHNAHMKKYRARKHYEQSNHLSRVSCTIDVSGLTNMCNQTQHKQANCLRDLISNFHRIVNKGPVYVCCCCEQLWYKHSVSSAAKLRGKHPDVDKYLLNKRSVDDIDWVCRSCH